MSALFLNLEFWKVLVQLAWPVVALIAFLLLFRHIKPLFQRENLQIEVAGMKIHVTDAAKNIGHDLASLQKKVAELEEKLAAGFPFSNADQVPFVPVGEAQRKRILWVDDFPSNNAFLIEKLQTSLNVEITLSLSTEDGLKQAAVLTPDLVITDLGRQENGINDPFAGLKLTRALREKNADLPILVFAGNRGMEHRSELTAAGATLVTQSGADILRFVETHLAAR